MDAKTALTIQRARGIAGGMNVNDNRYSCQGYMGRKRPRGKTRAAPRPAQCPPGSYPCSHELDGCCDFTEAYAGGPFPSTCDYCAPCGLYNNSTCTPCEGPARRQRWGASYEMDELGGRVCSRPCPPNPCFPPTTEIPPPPPPPELPPGRPEMPPPVVRLPEGKFTPTPPTRRPPRGPSTFAPPPEPPLRAMANCESRCNLRYPRGSQQWQQCVRACDDYDPPPYPNGGPRPSGPDQVGKWPQAPYIPAKPATPSAGLGFAGDQIYGMVLPARSPSRGVGRR